MATWIYALVLSFTFLGTTNSANSFTRDNETDFNIDVYHSYNEICNFIDNFLTIHKNISSLQPLGTSIEGRRLDLLKISANRSADLPAILVVAGTHAREWVSVASGIALIDHLTKESSLLKNFDWYFIPLANPDGYEYSRRVDRHWRKNRSKLPGSDCYGVDLNRNFDFHWGESESSDDPCDYEVYRGPAPFSELESRAIRDALLKNPNTILYMDLHSTGQNILYPYAYAIAYPNNVKSLKDLGMRMADAIQVVNGDRYTVRSTGDWYLSAGAADDYAKGVANVPYVYTIELTKGPGRFVFPEEKLPTLFEEVFAAFRVAVDYLSKGLLHRELTN